MSATALNDPEQQRRASTKEKTKTSTIVGAAILLAVAALLFVTYLMYRDAPRTGTPNEIDQAEGVTPQNPPAAPADPAPAQRP
jgi:hypothetical protein